MKSAPPPPGKPLTLLDCIARDGQGSTSSRARILEQQREVMLRRRQEAMRADVVRSVDDLSQQQHVAPAIPQFSSPRPEDADPTSAFGGTATLSSTLSSTASSTTPLNPTQVTEAKRSLAPSIQPPVPRGVAAGKPRSSAAAAFRAKSYRRVSRSSGDGEEEDADNGHGLTRQRSLLSADEEKARDGAFLAATASPRPPKPGRRRKEAEGGEEEGSKGKRKGDVALAVAAAAAADDAGRGFDLEALLSGPSGVARFVTTPCPPGAGVVQCYIKRWKKGV
jgi:hypothetical protein